MDITTRRRGVIKFTIIFFLIVLFFTFASGTVQTLLKPSVELYAVKGGSIDYTHEVEGRVTYKNTHEAVFGVDLVVEEVLVEDKQSVREGDVLMRLDVGGLELERRERELQIKRLRRRVLEAESGAEADELSSELAILEDALARFTSGYPAGGDVRAGADGVVVLYYEVRQTAPARQPLLAVVESSRAKVISFETSFEDGNNFFVGDSAYINYTGTEKDAHGMIHLKKVELKQLIEKKTHLPDEDMWAFESAFRPELRELFGERVRVTLYRVSPTYRTIVPVSCLTEIRGREAKVYIIETAESLFSIDTIARSATATIEEMNNEFAAITCDALFEGVQIARHSSKPLSSGASVTVAGEYE